LSFVRLSTFSASACVPTANRGVIYCATNHIAYFEAALISAIVLRSFHPELPITLVCDQPLVDRLPLYEYGIRLLPMPCNHQDRAFRSRDLKTYLANISPYNETLYLDSDILPIRPLNAIWDYLAQGDIAMVRDRQPTIADCDHIAHNEKAYTLSLLPGETPQYNSGVMLWRNSPLTQSLFKQWQQEWNKFQRHDQLALVRAIAQFQAGVVTLPINYNISPIDAPKLLAENEVYLLHCWGGQVMAGGYRQIAQQFYPEVVETVQAMIALLPQDHIAFIPIN
jgi:hypothetical protein